VIVIEAVQPTPREQRVITKGWGAIHWACIPCTYAFLGGLLVYGITANIIAGDVLPSLLFSGVLIVSWLMWWGGIRLVRRVSASATLKAPTGPLNWRWTVDREGLLFENGLQANRLDWAGVKTVQEEADRFLFLVTPSNNPVLPKRLLDGDQMDRFRALLAEAEASGRLGGGVDYQAPSSDKA
jgi:hypothetical protein